jgi:phosphoribosylanthranilate isomerase
MPFLVKICGLRTPDGLDAALGAGADLVGFVFFPPSPRSLPVAAARALGEQVRGRAGKVALTVDADDAMVEAIIATLSPDMLQLHGRETPDRATALKKKFGVPVMKAIPVETKADLTVVASYANVADRLLFDGRAPREATRPGGLGQTFDWHLLENLEPGVPFMLSGGLNAGNIAQALKITRAPGVDVSSGVERAPGEKDADKIHAFVRAAREAVSVASIA